MTRDEIREQRLDLEADLERHEDEVFSCEQAMERLQENCPHPVREPSGTPGRSPDHCPDCGKVFFEETLR